ncbi:MAG TPA: hypothetical protein PLR88_01060 [Bacteroidales bacterium]|nr:hypothetical protein [Bacteroidales bacterium]HPT20507.1 hypothetical protein [Bacteroidales bacterium]
MGSLHKLSVSVFLLVLSLTTSAVDHYRLTAGAGEAGLGYVCIMKEGFWSSFHNQATLASNNDFSFGLNYENRFNLKELGTRTAGIRIPAGKASLGAIYSHFGYADYRREMTGLGCGLKLTDKIAAGVQVDYFSEKALYDYADSRAVTFEAGFLISPSQNVTIGLHLFNFVPNSLRKTSMPTTLRTGVGAYLNSSLFAGIEAEMSSGSKLLVRTGFEYEAMKKLFLRGGFSTYNNSFSFGLGYLTKIVRMDLSFATHEKLGMTSSVSFVFKIH